MENASKALIIAGAILLSIAIIGVGMFVFNAVSGTIQDSVNMSDQEVTAYNQDFVTYEGLKRGNLVRALCDAVRSHNISDGANDPSRLIVLAKDENVDEDDLTFPAPTEAGTEGTTTGQINAIKREVLSGKTYDVSLLYDPDSGMVTKIVINDADGSTT